MNTNSKSKKLKVQEERLIDPLTNEYTNTIYADNAEVFSLKSFSDNTQIEIKELNKEDMIFDIKGIDPPLANALRRILISEIPTMAIEIVNMYQNTSIIPDEVLSHRIGLIPIFADANEFQNKKDNEEFNEFNAIYFKLHVKCEKLKSGEIINQEVTSGHIQWTPIGKQATQFVEENLIRVVHDDILIAKLRPGQEIEAELICVKGIGKTHAKWSPVSTAYYRLLPEITILGDITGEDAVTLKKTCPTGVFDVEEINGEKKAIVKDSRKCTTCRECIRAPQFKEAVLLEKIKDHYEFHIESVGIYEPEILFVRAFNILKEKCEMWSNIIGEKTGNERRMSVTK